MHETFWGVPCLSGDDKRLTTLVLERGYLTYMQRTAEVWSTFPNTWRIFFKQRLRWARNTWRSDLRALSRPWVYRHPFLAYTMVDKGLSGFTLLLGPAFMVHSLINQNWIFAAVLAGGGNCPARPSCSRICAGGRPRSSSSRDTCSSHGSWPSSSCRRC
jgi:hyaluronan synthase